MSLFIEGYIIVMDLDRFEDYTETHGLDQYKPNMVTATLTRLVDEFASKHRGVIIYGYDPERGTEEAVLEVVSINDDELREIISDLERIREEVRRLDASITIVMVRDYVLMRPARNRREAYYGTPGRRRALKLLRTAKRRGGGSIVLKI